MKIQIPTSLGFVLTTGDLTCDTGTATSFGTGGPVCTVSEDSSGTNTIITISNLATGNPTIYPFYFDIQNPSTAMVVDPNSIICESYTDDGTGVEVFYETFPVSTSIIVSSLLCPNEPSLSGYSTTVGGTSSVTISY